MSRDFYADISERTEIRTPPTFEFITFDPEQTRPPEPKPIPEPTFQPRKVVTEAEPRPERIKDPNLTADIATGTIDALQELSFYMLHKRVLVNKIFESTEEFKKAVKLTYVPRATIEKEEEPEKKLSLLARYDEFMQKLKEKTEDLPFSPHEQEMIRKPLLKLAELNPNFDLPPGWALVFAAMAVGIPRVMSVYQD